ncbi:hypothetical protein EUTSA_v10015438mg [Eutrema salsugineum]|uniref:DUF659 domain-containing protein n=1 Tax=Eutrema salsugineum TaxID=72664 RepID=V4LMB7_EUTSA|nr:hypothetical protein EUTSA_v10015438mg [Eutrema salsugineum]
MNDAEVRSSVNISEKRDEEEEVFEVEGMGVKKMPRMFEIACGPSIYISRWVYNAGIPFNTIANDDFKRMLEAAGQFGPGVTPPSQYQLREPLLREKVARVNNLMKVQEDEWKASSCSIMTDSWSDRKRRSIMNLCINCKEGTTFLSSKDCSDDAYTGQYIFEYVNGCIEKVGGDHVVQVVTDNATNNMAAAKLLKEVRPTIFWTSCATHTINLMVEGIAKLPSFETSINKAKAFTIFIYAHHKTLSMMRKFTKRRDIVQPRITRFASAFLTLQILIKKKEKLKMMFASNEWGETYNTTCNMEFWDGVGMCLKVFAPLVRILRLVDGDLKPTMGFLYGELEEAKKEICNALNNLKKNYKPILCIIDQKGNGCLDSPLHWMAYLLNPYYFYKDSTIQFDRDVISATFKCVDAFFPNDLNTQTFVHTKKQNRLDTKRLNNLVYVQFNMRLLEKRKKHKEKKVDILLVDNALHAQGWIFEEAEMKLEDTWETIGDDDGVVRELDESDFDSDDGEEVDVEFESDDEQILEEIW